MKHPKLIVAVSLVLLLGAVGTTWAEPVREDPVEAVWGSVLQWIDEVISVMFSAASNTDEMNGFIDPGGSPNTNDGASTAMPGEPTCPAS